MDLPSGGYLIIDYAEALTVIDVNSGSFIGRGKAPASRTRSRSTNLEAAEEVVNQLRLRDIGGIIVIDFIDMARARNRDAVMKTLRKTLDEDRTKTFTAEISKLGLVEMTRQNVTEGVREIMSRPCPTCDGEGVIRSEETIAIEFERRLRDVVARAPRRRGLPRADQPARQHPVHRPRLARAARARGETGKSFLFEGSEGLALDHFAITFVGTRAEVEERALPFRQGDEVLVEIVEPHMYAVDDAVAKIDGYIISIAGAAPHVGEKRMVRIDQVGRTAASALLLDENGEVVAPGAARQRRAAATRRRRARQPAPPGRGRARRGTLGQGRAARPERRAVADPEDAETRREAGLSELAGHDRLRARPAGSAPAGQESPGETEEDGLQSKPRRRGRRGGRRRSAAKAEATPE